MKNLVVLFILLMTTFGSKAQVLVEETANVKKPSEGKLYYAKKDKTLYLFRGTFIAIPTTTSTPTTPAVIVPSAVPETPTSPADADEILIGYWALPERILIAKRINNQYYLMQTNSTRSYYVARGINLINNNATKINVNSLPSIVSQNSDLGGLYPATNFPEASFLRLGFQKNNQGEYVRFTNSTEVTPSNPSADEITLGFWAVPERILIAKQINNQYYLMQTNSTRSYYVTRGINLLNHRDTKVNANTPSVSIVSQNSDLGGLYPSPNFPEAEFLKLGYSKNAQGEYVK